MADEIVVHDTVPGARAGDGGANVCHMPTPETPKMAGVYKQMRELVVRVHCADKRPAHKCAGAVTIDRTTITLNCPRCGDVRKIIEQEGADDATDA